MRAKAFHRKFEASQIYWPSAMYRRLGAKEAERDEARGLEVGEATGVWRREDSMVWDVQDRRAIACILPFGINYRLLKSACHDAGPAIITQPSILGVHQKRMCFGRATRGRRHGYREGWERSRMRVLVRAASTSYTDTFFRFECDLLADSMGACGIQVKKHS